MTKLRILAAMAVGALTATLCGFGAHAQTASPVEARNVVLVHRAWADGSSWAEVIPLLQAAGLRVTAVQNPLTSLADSVAATRRALALQDGPTVLVAHSWGGTVISERGLTRRSPRLSMSRRGGSRRRRRFCRPFRKVSYRIGAGWHPATRRLHHNFRGAVPSILRERCHPHESRSALCRAGADGRRSVWRTNHRCCLALKAVMVCRVETRPDDQSRPGAISRKTHECDHC
jgi:pimeloyl-ACP methyl ester carboxylesterase